MIAFAACIGDHATFERYAAPGLVRSVEPDSALAAIESDSIFAGYNEALDAFAQAPDLEALVLMHEDVTILDPGLCAKIRVRLADPSIAVIGAIGARGVRSLCWWEGSMRGRVAETRGTIDCGGGCHDVDAVDGLLMVLSPWAVRTLRFDDERFHGFHGYDVDLCLQARAAGRRVVVDDLDVVHHTRGGIGDGENFWAADRILRDKWRRRGLIMATDAEMSPDRRGFAVAPRGPSAAPASTCPTAPRVSAIVAAYNYAHYLPEALESALAQNYPADRLEIIVVDDGSTDETAEVVAGYCQRSGGRIRYVHQDNQGLAAATTRGLLEARGELITFLDADDAWPADRTRLLVDALERHPEAGLVYGDMEIIDGEGRVLAPSWFASEGVRPRSGRVLAELLRGNFISAPALMVRACHMSRFAPVPSFSPYQDWYVAARIAEVAEVRAIPDVVARYRRHGSNMNHGRRAPADLAAVIAKELPLRRWMLANLRAPDLSPRDLADAFTAFIDLMSSAAQATGRSAEHFLAVTESERRRGAELTAMAHSPSEDPAAAAGVYLRALAADPFNAAARAGMQTCVDLTAPRFSIVIVAYGKRAITERCLDSLESALGPALGREVELVLVDNASPDDTLSLFARWQDRATVVALPRNVNFAGGCNVAAVTARGRTLVFLNNDTIVTAGALEALVGEAEQPEVGAAGLRLHYLDGRIQHAGVLMLRVGDGLAVPHHAFHYHEHRSTAARATCDLDCVTGACLAMGRTFFLGLGGFDEGYVNGWEDVDLCLRTRMAGRRVVYRGDLWMWHDEGQTRGTVRGADENAARFYARWGTVLEPDDELVGRIYGGVLPDTRRPLGHGTADLVVGDSAAGVESRSAEARGLLAALSCAGLRAGVRDVVTDFVEAELSSREADLLRGARALQWSADTATIQLRPGAIGAGDIVRLAGAPAPHGQPLRRVWAATEELCDTLRASGAAEEVLWLPPCVPTGEAGPGGAGILAVLPAHDLEVCERALSALTRFASHAVRVVPTVASTPLLRLIHARLPRASVLPPCPSDARFRELALGADVALCLDGDDPFERRQLVAAGAGAAVPAGPHGVAAAILGPHAAMLEKLSERGIERAVAECLGLGGDRARRAEVVAESCSEQACGRIVAGAFGLTPVA